jgi:hypothetical protein
MNDHDSSGLTIVGGRPSEEGKEPSGVSLGLQALLQRLAENPSLARDLVTNPEGTLAAEGLTLTPTELAMLHHLDVEDLGQTRAVARGAMRSATLTREMKGISEQRRITRATRSVKPTKGEQPGCVNKLKAALKTATRGAEPAREEPSDVEAETRRRLAAQLELVAPFAGDPDFYMGERTRGIRPMSIYPTPFAVAEALLRSSADFRAAFLADSRQAILTRPDLPLSDEERQTLLSESVRKRLEHVARNG